jgi:hypothetical protein
MSSSMDVQGLQLEIALLPESPFPQAHGMETGKRRGTQKGHLSEEESGLADKWRHPFAN